MFILNNYDSKTGETLASRKLISSWRAELYNAWRTDSWIIGEVLSLSKGYVIKVLGLIALLSSDLTDEQ